MPQAQHLETLYNIYDFFVCVAEINEKYKNVVGTYCGKMNDILPLEQLKIFSKREQEIAMKPRVENSKRK
jgi:hypothetical protein